MEYEKYRETIIKMKESERQVAMLLYLKDIKDILMSFAESKEIDLKHY